MKANRATLAEILDVSLPSIDRFVRDGMPYERRGRKGTDSRFDVGACIAWLRARDAARAPLPRTAPSEPRASREALREALRSLWLDPRHAIPWQHEDLVPLDEWERGVGLKPRGGESIDLMRLGLPVQPPVSAGGLCRVSLPHAHLWRTLLGGLVQHCGGDSQTPYLGREMRRLCGYPLIDEDDEDAPAPRANAASGRRARRRAPEGDAA